jgi:CRP-like cAMP-binding protein
MATNGRGDGIGEIALLYGVPRTATVTATSPATVFALSREDFLNAVAGHTPTARAAAAIADERLDHDHRRERLKRDGESDSASA